MRTPVQEFAVEAKADDDYAVKNLELVYSVNGGAEKTIKLFDGRQPLQEVTAGHTFYLEELGVQAGDAVSYYARATDNNAVAGPQRATSDMYFLRIRPFNKDFKPATSMGGGGGGGGGGMDQVGALSQQQRQIIAGTFNMQRDRKQMAADKFREGMTVLTLSQSRLREQVEGLVERMNSRLVTPDPAFQKIAELLPQAAESMKAAEGKLQGQSPDGALPPEQRALQLLQQAEEEFELQVQTQRNSGGGGGGGGAGSIAEDLADLFQMELDKHGEPVRDQPAQPSQQAGDQRIDELAEKLKELARRQEQELERQRRMAAGQAPARQQQRAAARRWPSRPRRPRGSSSGSRAIRTGRTWPTPRVSCATPPTRCVEPRPTAMPARRARPRPPPSGCAKRSDSCSGRRAIAPAATCRTRCGRPRRSRANRRRSPTM